jgi:hypothetical protein
LFFRFFVVVVVTELFGRPIFLDNVLNVNALCCELLRFFAFVFWGGGGGGGGSFFFFFSRPSWLVCENPFEECSSCGGFRTRYAGMWF